MGNRQLVLGTISFAICFAAWGLMSAFAPRFREIYSLSASQTALLVATPVLLGSLARIPMGLLTDRWKGRAVFSGLLLFSAIPPFLAPVVSSYSMLLVVGFFLGVAGSSFAVGVGFVSPWFGSEKQGTALGVFGLGNAGQSVVVFLGPLLAARFGWESVFRGISIRHSFDRPGASGVSAASRRIGHLHRGTASAGVYAARTRPYDQGEPSAIARVTRVVRATHWS